MKQLLLKLKDFDKKYDNMGTSGRLFLYTIVMAILGSIAIAGVHVSDNNIIWKIVWACLIVLTSVYYAFGPIYYYIEIFSDWNTKPSIKKLGAALKNMDREFSEFSIGKRFYCLALIILTCLMVWSMITLPCIYLVHYGVLDSNPGYHPISKGILFFLTALFNGYVALRK